MAARTGKRTKIGKVPGGKGGGKRARELTEYDSSQKLPDVESCCRAFQWLLWDASKVVWKLSGITERHGTFGDAYDEHSVLEHTVKRIWFRYLHKWAEAAAYYSKKYPEMRVSFRDLFLSDSRRSMISGHLSVVVGKRVEEEMIEEMQRKLRDGGGEDNGILEDDGSISSLESGTSRPDNISADNSRKKKKMRRPVLSIPRLCSQVFNSQRTSYKHRQSNGCYRIDPYKAVLQIQPSLTLLLSIMQLALVHLKTGYAPYHLTSWVANGLLPHALNGYVLLPTDLKEKVGAIKQFFMRSFIPPADVVDDLAFLLAASIGWFDDSVASQDENTDDADIENMSSAMQDNRLGRKQKTRDGSRQNKRSKMDSLYNIPMLAARMVKDLGLDQPVLDNALALMGLHPPSTILNTNNQSNIALAIASPSKLYTPLHVAAVIVIACKLCKGWETWKICNLNSIPDDVKFVPWNDSQLELVSNGQALDHYVNFLKNTALNGLNCRSNVSQFFQTLDANMAPQAETTKEGTSPEPGKSLVLPNATLCGVRNPNALKMPREGDKDPTNEQLLSRYSMLIEFVCYTIEVTTPAKLHELVTVFEDELLGHKK